MALELTQPVTEFSVRNISWGKGGRCVGLTTLLPSCGDCLMGLFYLYMTEEIVLICYTYCYVTSVEQRGTHVCALVTDVLVYCSNECRLLQFSSVPFFSFFFFFFFFWMNSALWHCVVQSSPDALFVSDLRFISDICVACMFGDSSLKSSFLFALCRLLPSAIAYDAVCQFSLNPVLRILDSFCKTVSKSRCWLCHVFPSVWNCSGFHRTDFHEILC